MRNRNLGISESESPNPYMVKPFYFAEKKHFRGFDSEIV